VDILELLPVVPAVVDILAWAADRAAVDSPAVDPDSPVAVLRTAAELLLVALEVVVVLQGSLREPVLDSHLDIRLVGVLHKELLAAVANPVGMGVANQAAVGETDGSKCQDIKRNDIKLFGILTLDLRKDSSSLSAFVKNQALTGMPK